MYLAALTFRVLLLFVAVAMGAATVQAEERGVALVIGNSAYQYTPKLLNPRNDAADIAAALRKLDFDVIEGLDLDKPTMDRKIREFAEKLPKAKAGILFYAGHGLQVDGQNYLVPIDAKLSSPAALDFEAVPLDLIQRTMERAGSTNILFLDACRDNPLARNLVRGPATRSVQVGQGLAAIESGEGTLISFSTKPGSVAVDGQGRNSPFSAALLKHISDPGEDLASILIEVRKDVIRATRNRQVPWEHSALVAKFYFGSPPPTGPSPEQLKEIALWESIKDSTNPASFRSYLEQYPQGTFATLARLLIDGLEKQERADRAARELELKRVEQERKAAEIARLEEQRRSEAIRRAEELRRAEEAKNAADAARLEEQRRLDAARRADELRKAQEEARIAREAANQANEQRAAADRAAEEARRKADAETKKTTEKLKLAALPKQAVAQFDGSWKVHRASSNCGRTSVDYNLHFSNGSVSGTTRIGKISGSVSAGGQLKFSHPGGNGQGFPDGSTVSYSGLLSANSASGHFFKNSHCNGTFTARRS
jgi:uncharacterized caspase-like protein